MINYEEARDIALSKWDEFDYCTEYENAFVFSKYDDMSIGGCGPIAVMKGMGVTYDFAYYLCCFHSKRIREGYLSEFDDGSAKYKVIDDDEEE